MKILIVGNGWLGNILKNYLKADITTARIEDINEPLDYDVVINTAAKTSIDWCETHREECFTSNVLMAIKLAKLTKGKFVQFSSACVFESKNPKDIKYEDSIPNPQCFYSETKLMAERLILEVKPDALIIRPRLLISETAHPRNTIDKLLKYTKVIDSKESVTILEDMLPVIKYLMETNASGVYHIVNEGLTTPAEIMKMYGESTFTVIPKKALDKELAKQIGRAKRTSVSIGSKKIPLMPHISKRISEVIEKHKMSKTDKSQL